MNKDDSFYRPFVFHVGCDSKMLTKIVQRQAMSTMTTIAPRSTTLKDKQPSVEKIDKVYLTNP
jgi:hypothetical protein